MITYTTNAYGLRQKDMDYMLDLFASVPAVEKVILYGSRANGTFEKGSDVDLAIVGDAITSKDIMNIHAKLESNSPALLRFDVLHYNNITNPILKQQIEGSGKVIFTIG